jgi:hypothetical protein
MGHANIDPIPGTVATENPNDPPLPTAMTLALRWVTDRYPPEAVDFASGPMTEPFAINFPAGTRTDVARRVCANVNTNSQPLEADNQTLPIYHVGRIWLRGDLATVDILRPVGTYGQGAEGPVLYQCITIKMQGGLRPFGVVSHRIWPVNYSPVPPLRLLPPGPDQRVQPPAEPDQRDLSEPAMNPARPGNTGSGAQAPDNP